MHTERGFDRLVNFSDATVAIAMTLLVLPLVELGGASQGEHSLWDLFRDNAESLLGFVLGFLVIWSQWTNHHRVMEYYADYDSTVLTLHLVWLMTIVAIPFTTQLVTNDEYYKAGGTAVYVAVLLVSSICLHTLGWHGRRHPKLLNEDDEAQEWIRRPYRWTTALTLVGVLVVVLVFPVLGAWPLLLLFVGGAIESSLQRREQQAAES